MVGRRFRLAVSLGLALWAPGCLLDSSAYEAAGAGAAAATPSGSGSGSGSGGATTPSSGGNGGNGGAGASAGAGGTTTTSTTPTGCTDDVDCPDDPSPCLDPKCDEGTCTAKNANDGAACGDPAGICYGPSLCKGGACAPQPLKNDTAVKDMDEGNCQKNVCDGQGNVISKNDDQDVPASNHCAEKSCMGGAVKEVAQNEGEFCFVGSECCDGHCCTLACSVCAP